MACACSWAIPSSAYPSSGVPRLSSPGYPLRKLRSNAGLRRAKVGSPPPYSARSSLRLGSTLVAPPFFRHTICTKSAFCRTTCRTYVGQQPLNPRFPTTTFLRVCPTNPVFYEHYFDRSPLCRTSCRTYVGQLLKNPHFPHTTSTQICPTN